MSGQRILRIAAWVVLGFVAVLLALLILLYTTLRSPGVQQRILASVREPLEEHGFTPEIGRLSIDLLGGVELEDLTLDIRRQPLAAGRITLKSLRLTYQFWPLLHQELRIKELALIGLGGELQLILPTPPETAPQQDLDLRPLIAALRQPPLLFDSPTVSFRDLSLRVRGQQGQLQFAAELESAELEAALGLQAGRLDAQLKGQVPLRFDVTQTSVTAAPQRVRGRMTLELDPRLTVQLREQQLQWQVLGKTLQLDLEELRFEQASGVLDLPRLHLQQDFELKHEGPLTAAAALDELLWPLEIKLGQELQIPGLRFQRNTNPTLGAELGLQVQQKLQLAIPSLEKWREISWELQQTVSVDPLRVDRGADPLMAARRWEWAVTGQGRLGRGQISGRYQGTELRSTLWSRAFDLEQQLDLQLELPEQSLQTKLTTLIDRLEILQLDLALRDPSDRQLKGNLRARLSSIPRLKEIHPAAAALEPWGYPQVAWQQEFEVQHPQPWSQFTADRLDELTITSDLQVSLQQTGSKNKTLVQVRDVELKSSARLEGGQFRGSLQLEAQGVQQQTLRRALDVSQDLTLEGTYKPRLDLELHGKTRLDQRELLQLEARVQDKPQVLELKSSLLLAVKPELQSYLSGLEILQKLGPLQLESRQTFQVKHGLLQAAEVQDWSLPQLHVDAQLSQVLRSLETDRPYTLQKALKLDTRALLQRSHLELTSRMLAPQVLAQDLAQVRDLKLGVKASVDSLATLGRIEVKTVLEAGQVQPLGRLGERPELKDLLQRIQVIAHAIVRDKKDLRLEKLYAGVRHPMLTFRASGQGNSTGRGNLQGRLELDMPSQGPLRGSGRFQLPLQLTVYDKRKLSLRADPSFQNFSLEFGEWAIRNAQGSMQVHEELGIDAQGRIGFLFLETHNPFARVDYDTVEPYVGDGALLSIDQIRWKHLQIGPIVQNFELRQNLVRLNDFKAGFLDGSLLGRFYFDLHPSRLQLGFLGRFSQLRAEQLKPAAQRRATQADAVLSGRIGTSFDIRQRLATGRIDLTAIGRSQLLSLLDVLDPDYKDSQIQLARRGLRIAYPRQVSVAMGQGLMDLTIALDGALSQDVSVRSIPLTPLINAHLGEMLLNVEKMMQSEEETP